MVASVALPVACTDDEPSGETSAGTAHAHGAGHPAAAPFEGGIVSPRRAAPPLALADHEGVPFDLRDMRGRPVLVTFVYVNCPDVCPAIMQRLRRVRELAGSGGGRLRVVAVSVDPEGDTPHAVDAFLERQRLDGFTRFLIGDRPALERAWADWDVGTRVPTDDPALIEHTALIYGVGASGRLITAYPLQFDPAAIARDLRLLAGA